MEQEIQERTDRLMESEKLALVGSLVAGVAHEINTPVGNGITISSWLATRTKEIQEKAGESILTPEDLGSYLADVDSSLAILQSGLDRTSNLIQSFKKIGADQVVDERRVIALRNFLQEVVTSLQPTLKRFPHDVVIDCAQDFAIENHPGALFQIVTNLVLNAHHHAFAAEQEGQITLVAHTASDAAPDFSLIVRDNGSGMTPEVQARIFQPFFTTKRQQGGTGLGLSIVHNLVQNLGGTIEVKSTRGAGSEFRLVLPKRAPDRTATAPSAP
jgi:signal transduction histidine kinase